LSYDLAVVEDYRPRSIGVSRSSIDCRDPAERERLALLLGVLAVAAKSWPPEHCLEANKPVISG